MKISPIDIRQHTFEKGFRGYDIDDNGDEDRPDGGRPPDGRDPGCW